ncbi:hypothetical protein IW261DRAFT_1570436 [Armillaria novae-zelandiae]|uniref:Uncharacterized protein n=1 Tax=Armillaria novae-zelandiae TaxID=153914 RepID=A0AA39NVY6_9AGAR|nr:hypothetical protein IW261DRAFT_1570436 [Armillaria novae-zelandiae]
MDNHFGNGVNLAYMPISIATASDEVLRLNGDIAYMQVCLRLGAVEREKEAIEKEKEEQSMELTALKMKYDLLQETIDKLIKKILLPPLLQSNGLPQPLPRAPPLSEKDYPCIRFWKLKTYHAFLDEQKGKTNGLATSKPKRGRPQKVSDADDDDDSPSRHPYLEDDDGNPKCLKTLLKAGLAPEKWGAIDNDAEDYFDICMTNEFKVFQTCDGGWKLKMYITKMYPSWALHNHPAKALVKKQKQDPFEDNALIAPKHLWTSTPEPFLDTTNLFHLDEANEKCDEVSSETISEDAKPWATSQEPKQVHGENPVAEAHASLKPITDPLDDLYEVIDAQAPVHLPSDQEVHSPAQKDQQMEEPKPDQEQDQPQCKQDNLQHNQGNPQHKLDQPQHEQDRSQYERNQPQSNLEASGTITKALQLATPGASLTQKSVSMCIWIAKDPQNNRLKVDFEAYYTKIPKDTRLKLLEEAKAAKKVADKKSKSSSTKNKPVS